MMNGIAERLGNAKHTWNSMKFSQSVSLVIVMMHWGRSYWEATGGDDAQQIWQYNDTTWSSVGLLQSRSGRRGRSLEMEPRGGSYGTADALWHLRWLFFHQPKGFSREQKRQPHEGETISTSTTWVTVQNTHAHTLGHKQVHMNSVRVQRLISVTTRVENTAGHLAPTVQLSCHHIKTKQTIWIFLYQLCIQTLFI